MIFKFVGAWRRLVAHLYGVQGVGGSNPLAPTNIDNNQETDTFEYSFFYCLL